MEYTPYIEIKDSKIEIASSDVVETVDCEIINEESRFIGSQNEIWGDNEHYEVENSLTRVLIILLIIAIVYFLIKSFLNKKTT